MASPLRLDTRTSMADDRDTALLDAELAELCALPYSYWRAALNTTYEKTVTESPPGRRTSRLTVSVIKQAAGSGHSRHADAPASVGCQPAPSRPRDRPDWSRRETERRRGASRDRTPGRPQPPDAPACLGPTAGDVAPRPSRPRGAVRGRQRRRLLILQSVDAAPTGRIGVRLMLPPPDDALRVSATVVHAQPGMGFGVQFTDLTHTHRQALHRTVTLLQPGRVP